MKTFVGYYRVSTEKQGIDAALESLAAEDKRFWTQADLYWNASYTATWPPHGNYTANITAGADCQYWMRQRRNRTGRSVTRKAGVRGGGCASGMRCV